MSVKQEADNSAIHPAVWCE